MSKFYTAKDLEKMIAQGTCLGTLPADAKFTPMARDILRKHKVKPGGSSSTASNAGSQVKIHTPVLPDAEYNWVPGGDPKTAANWLTGEVVAHTRRRGGTLCVC